MDNLHGNAGRWLGGGICPCGRTDRVGSSEHGRVRSDRYKAVSQGWKKQHMNRAEESIRKRVEEICHRTDRAHPGDRKGCRGVQGKDWQITGFVR